MDSLAIARQYFDTGLSALERGELRSAQDSFKFAYAHEPLRPSIVQNFLEVSHRLGDIGVVKSVCLGVLSKARAGTDIAPVLLITALKALVLSGLLGEVRSVLSEVHTMNSFDCRLISDLIEVSIAAGDAESARRFLTELEGVSRPNPELGRLAGRILSLEGDYAGAIAKFTELPPEIVNSPENLHDLGRCYAAMKRYQEAYTRFVYCLNLGGGVRKKQLLVSLANVSRELGLPEKAIDYLGQARQSVGDDLGLDSEYIYRSLVAGHWDNLDDFPSNHDSSASLTDSDPLTLLSHLDDADTIFRMTSFHASLNTRSNQIPPLPVCVRASSARRLRIGFVSSDFRHHAVGYLLRSFFRYAGDREECVGIDISPYATDEVTSDISASCTEFHSVSELGDRSASTRIRNLGLDIAIDLNGYTEHGRPWLFYSRIAPIQVNYLGYPGTMGHPSYDFIIGDETVIPPQHESFYSEQVLRLDSCYQINDDRRETPKSEIAPDLPSGRFVFGCFHNYFKINPTVFSAWMGILQRCPNSILWLLSGTDSYNSNICRRAESSGICPDRIFFAPRVPLRQHISRHLHVDLFLDTWPYGGHTSVSDVVWVGKPVIAMCGRSFASRVSASILLDAGLAGLIFDDVVEYTEKAVSLYSDAQQLAYWSAKATAAKKSRLFKTAEKADNFFMLLRQVVQR